MPMMPSQNNQLAQFYSGFLSSSRILAIADDALDTLIAASQGEANTPPASPGDALPQFSAEGEAFAVAAISIHGIITRGKLNSWLRQYATSVTEVEAALHAAEKNDDIQGIFLYVDSPGGVVGGMSQLSAAIREAKKPVHAFIDSMGCSAAYWIASSADRVTISPEGVTACVGVVATGYNMDGLMKKFGIKSKMLRSRRAQRKNLGMFDAGGEEDLQKELDAAEAVFHADIIAGRRKKMTAEDLEKLAGRAVPAPEAAEVGAVDGVNYAGDALDGLIEAIKKNKENAQKNYLPPAALKKDGKNMEKEEAPQPEKTSADIDAAVKEAREKEKTRVSAILNLAKGSAERALMSAHVADGSTVEAAGLALLKHREQQEAVKSAQAGLTADGSELQNITPSESSQEATQGDIVAQWAKEVARLANAELASGRSR